MTDRGRVVALLQAASLSLQPVARHLELVASTPSSRRRRPPVVGWGSVRRVGRQRGAPARRPLDARRRQRRLVSSRTGPARQLLSNFTQRQAHDRKNNKQLYVHTYTRLTALFPGLPRSAGIRKVKTDIFILNIVDYKMY